MKFSRPFGTETHRESDPNAEALGYCQPSLRGENRAMFPFLDDDVFGAELVDGPGGAEHVSAFGQLMSFALVEHKTVDTFEQPKQIFQSDVEPEVHGVCDDEFGLLHLVQHMRL